MLLLFWVVLLLVGACLILLMPALWGKQIYNLYRAPRTVNCPETHSQVVVRFDAWRAALTGLADRPKLRLADCSRWPVHADCGQDCIPDAVRATPDLTVPMVPRTRTIPNLPVLIAAAAAWVLGMAWHSEYWFRPQWMSALGLSDRQTRDLAEMWSTHLLTVGACLLFAYGVAWVMNWMGKRSIFSGIRVALSMWLVMVAALILTTRSLVPQDLIRIEGGYTLFAALLIGAIAGGLPRRVFIKDSE